MNSFNIFNSQLKVPLAGLPVALVLLLDGSLVFIRDPNMRTIIDSPEKGIGAVFTSEAFWLGDTSVSFDYDVAYDYKDVPEMLQWLKQQNLIMPQIV